MPSELELVQLEKVVEILAIIAALILLQSAFKAESTLIQEQSGSKLAASAPTSSQLTFLGEKVLLTERTLNAYIATERLKQRASQLKPGENISTLEPNVLSKIGTRLVVLGTILGTIAAKERLDQEANITIF